jgi:hypothetical protein
MINDSRNGRVMITEASVEEIQYAHGESTGCIYFTCDYPDTNKLLR